MNIVSTRRRRKSVFTQGTGRSTLGEGGEGGGIDGDIGGDGKRGGKGMDRGIDKEEKEEIG